MLFRSHKEYSFLLKNQSILQLLKIGVNIAANIIGDGHKFLSKAWTSFSNFIGKKKLANDTKIASKFLFGI